MAVTLQQNINDILRQYFPKVTDLSGGKPATSMPSPTPSTTVHGKSSDGGLPPKSSVNNYTCYNNPVLHRPIEPAHYLFSLACTDRLVELGSTPSVGTVRDSYDNALAESVNSAYKTELIRQRGSWRTVEQAELATLELVWWYNNHRLHEALG